MNEAWDWDVEDLLRFAVSTILFILDAKRRSSSVLVHWSELRVNNHSLLKLTLFAVVLASRAALPLLQCSRCGHSAGERQQLSTTCENGAAALGQTWASCINYRRLNAY